MSGALAVLPSHDRLVSQPEKKNMISGAFMPRTSPPTARVAAHSKELGNTRAHQVPGARRRRSSSRTALYLPVNVCGWPWCLRFGVAWRGVAWRGVT